MMLLQDKSGVLQAIYQIASPHVQSIKLNGRGLGTGLIMDGLYFRFMEVLGYRYMSVGATTVSADMI